MGVGKIGPRWGPASCIVDAQVPLISISSNKSSNNSANNDWQPSRASFEGIHFYAMRFSRDPFFYAISRSSVGPGKKCCILRRAVRPSVEIQFALFKNATHSPRTCVG